MALIKCPECGNDVSDNAISCPNCGFQIKQHIAAEKAKNDPYAAAKKFNKKTPKVMPKNQLEIPRLIIGGFSVLISMAAFQSAIKYGISNIAKAELEISSNLLFFIAILICIAGAVCIVTFKTNKLSLLYVANVLYGISFIMYIIGSNKKFSLFRPWPLVICISILVCSFSIEHIKFNKKIKK